MFSIESILCLLFFSYNAQQSKKKYLIKSYILNPSYCKSMLKKLILELSNKRFVTTQFLYTFCFNVQQNKIQELLTVLKKVPNSEIAHFKLATLYKKNQKAQLAIKHFKRAIKLKPKFKQAYESMAQAYQQMNNFQQALKYYRKLTEFDKKNMKLSYKIAKLLFNNNELIQSLREYFIISSKEPQFFRVPTHNQNIMKAILIKLAMSNWIQSSELYELGGDYLYLLKQKKEALIFYQESLRMNPAQQTVNLKLGEIMYNRKDFLRAQEYLLKSLQMNDKCEKTINLLAQNYSALKEYQKTNYYLNRLLILSPNASGYYNIGVVFLRNRYYEQAKQCFFKALEINPNSQHTFHALAQLYDEIGQSQQAVSYAKKMFNLLPSTSTLNILAHFYQNSGDIEQAIYYFNKSVENDPNNVRGNYSLGLIYKKKKDLENLKKFYLNCVLIKTSDKNQLIYQLKACEELQDFARGAKICQKILQNQQNSDDYQSCGVFFFKAKLFQKSIECFQKAIELKDQKDGLLYNNIGYVFKHMKIYEKAQQYFLKSIQIDPELFLPKYNLAELYQKKDQIDKAKFYAQKAQISIKDDNEKQKLQQLWQKLR